MAQQTTPAPNFERVITSLNIVVISNGVRKDIAKVKFKSNTKDFYVLFPYYKCATYHCGMHVIAPGQTEGSQDAVANGTTSSIPVKFSYHLDGSVHFKPVSRTATTDLPNRLAGVQSVPIEEFNNTHIFTIQFEGLAKFAVAPDSRSGSAEEHVIEIADASIKQIKIVGFAGYDYNAFFTREDGVPPWAVVALIRPPNPAKPLFIAMYAFMIRQPLIAPTDTNRNGLFVLVGFNNQGMDPNVEQRSLYLFAR